MTSRSTEETTQEATRLLKAYDAKAYNDAKNCRKALRKCGIKSKIARKGKERGDGWGSSGEWWSARCLDCKPLPAHEDRLRAASRFHQAFLDLGCTLICWRFVQRLR